MEGKIRNIIVQPGERIEIEYRTKINHKEFYFLKSKLSLERNPEYHYDLYKIYNSDSMYRVFSNENKEIKTTLMKFQMLFLNIKYNLSVSIEKILTNKYENNIIFMQRRNIERYYYETNGFIASISKVITSSKKEKHVSYEIELECETKDVHLGEKIFLSLLMFIKFPFNMPISPGKNMMKKIIYNYYLSPKADGERVFLVIKSKEIWHYNRRIDIAVPPGVFSEELLEGKEIVIDCEFLEGVYYLFDLPFLTENNYEYRKKKLSEIFEILSKVIPSELKDSKRDIASDGLIFTPQGKYSEAVYKIKHNPTIEVIFPLTDEVKEYLDSRKIFPSLSNPDDKEKIYEIDLQGRIIKARKDKSLPNPLVLIKKIANDDSWEKYKEITESNGCQMMKYHHNMIKEKILDIISGKLLDIGDGTGEDIKKWNKRRNIKEVFVVEENNDVRSKISLCNKKINLIDIEFNNEFQRKYNNKQKNMTMFFCLSKVIKRFNNIDDLSETIKKLGIRNLYMINIFEEDVSYKECNRWSISSEGEERLIKINGTKSINIREKKVYFRDLEKSMKKQGYRIGKKYNLPNPNIDCLSQEERELNKFYSYVYFTKKDEIRR